MRRNTSSRSSPHAGAVFGDERGDLAFLPGTASPSSFAFGRRLFSWSRRWSTRPIAIEAVEDRLPVGDRLSGAQRDVKQRHVRPPDRAR
jgi:hypothetical protein